MTALLAKIDIPNLIIGMIIGGFFAVLLQEFLQKPRLKIQGSGSGGGPGPGYHETHVSIWNPPALIGIPLPETVLLGLRLWRNSKLGVSFNRGVASRCTAWLWDKETNQAVTTLQWRVGGQIKPVVDIQPGENADLMLFARLHDEPTRYFVYQADPTGNLNVPAPEARSDATKVFLIEIHHSYDAKKRFRVKVIRGFDGRLCCKIGRGSSSF